MADMQDFAGVVALAIKAAMAPVLERVATMEAQVTALASVDRVLTELRERVVVAETKAAALVPVDLSPVRERVTELESKAAGLARGGDVQALGFDVETLKSRLAVVEAKPEPVASTVDVDSLLTRVEELETKVFQPQPLTTMIERTDRAVSELTKDLGALRERVAVAEVRQGVPGPAGTAGKDGRDGIDGLGFDDMAVEFDGERTLTIKAARGDRQKAWPFVLPYQYQRGVYVEGKTYQQGDLVTWAGSQWHANEDTQARPGEGSKAWTLVVKRGRDGKDGKDAVTLPVVSLGGSRG